jgi:predicted nucleic acid-binding protein
MAIFEDVMALAVQLPTNERERLGKALGLKLEAPKNLFPMAQAPDLSRTDPAAWKAREAGHAVLLSPRVAGATGPEAIRGMWTGRDALDSSENATETVSRLPPGSPVVVHSSVVFNLALGGDATRAFWANPGVEVRLATPTYLLLLQFCGSDDERARAQEFVAPFAVLSLGPMASNRAVQLVLDADGKLSALDALIAATALAHEIPLVTRTPSVFASVAGLQIAVLA